MTGSADAIEAGVGGFLERMLPDADDFPALVPELAGDAAVAGHVGLAFAVPEGAVGFGTGVALGAAVPEASVDEDGDLLFGNRGLARWPLGKSKVGLSRQREMPSPAGDLAKSEEDQQSVLGFLVSLGPNERHGLRSLCP